MLGLPWFCPEKPELVKNEEGQDVTEYTFQFDPPINEIGGNFIESEVLKLGKSHVSFETMCHRLEAKFCDAELGLVCRCCTEDIEGWFGNTTALQFPTRSGTRRGARAKVVWTLQALLAVPVGMPWASTYVVTNIVTSGITCGGRAHFTRACSMFRFWFFLSVG